MSLRVLLMTAVLVGGSFSAFAADPQSVGEADQAAKTVTKPAATLQRRAPAKPEAGRVEPGSSGEKVDTRVLNDAARKNLKPKLPDLTVAVGPPLNPTQAASAYVKNEGEGDVQSPFTAVVEISSWCEAGKLKSTVPAHEPSQTVPALKAGEGHHVMVIPASMNWGANGCYYHVSVRADSWAQVPESNENNNKGTRMYCPTGSTCY